MAYLTVTTPVDVVNPADGKLSLREAVTKANAGPGADTILFAAAIEGATLTLTQGELGVTQDLAIDGRDRSVTISGNRAGRILNITGAGTDVRLSNVTIADGEVWDGRDGGAILLGGGSLAVSGSTIRGNRAYDADSNGGAIYAADGSRLSLTDSTMSGNYAYGPGGGIATGRNVTVSIQDCTISRNGSTYPGGALSITDSNVSIERSTLSANGSQFGGGGVAVRHGRLTLSDSTVANNSGEWAYDAIFVGGAGIQITDQGSATITNSTVTGNVFGDYQYTGRGGGIRVEPGSTLEIANSIVAGNSTTTRFGSTADPDIAGTVTRSNGHNVFGSKVAGSVPGDRQDVAASAVFATIDPKTGGGVLLPKGIVRLNPNPANPALSAADPITSSRFGQLGTTPRPRPAGSLPDIGAIEIKQQLSTSPTTRNDVITGNGGANHLSGLAGNDLIRGLAGKDVLRGQDGSDVLEGGPGNDTLDGGNGFDIASFAGNTAVVVDLSAKPATARRGGETDTLVGVEGVIGSDKADSFRGDGKDNEFQGGPGKDVYVGGGGRDLYAFWTVQDSLPWGKRDIIKDFAPGEDVIDVSNIDADTTIPGPQSFRWVGKAKLTGAAQLGYYYSGGNTIVRASTDADAKPELEIQLDGKKVLKASDFRL